MLARTVEKIIFYRSLQESAIAGLSSWQAVEGVFDACAQEPFLSSSLVFRLLEAHSGQKAPPFRVPLAVLHAVAARLREGATFSAALAHHPAEFQAWELSVIRIGELTGRLDTAFDEAAGILESRKSDLLGLAAAAAQPALIQCLVPWIVCAPLVPLAGVLVYLAVASALFLVMSPAGKLLLSPRQGTPFNPGVMPFFAKMQLSKSLAALIEAGVAPDEALAEAAQAAGTQKLGEPGEPLHERLGRYKMFSGEELACLRIAEESGKLGDGLEDLAKQARDAWLLASLSAKA